MTKKKTTLNDEEMITDRPMGRRGSMAMLGAAVVGAVGLVGAMTPSEAEAQCTDSDGGYGADPAGRGRRCCRGISDRDPSDPVGCGRRSCSDSDPHDPGGAGRHC